MGITPFGTSFCKCSNDGAVSVPAQGNPDPRFFEIVKTETCKGMLVTMLKYPDCKNYEGLKIMVYDKMSDEMFRCQIRIDPHFCDNHPSPIARFEPTDRGWKMALAFCKAWKGAE
jgi:hypothetical protein